MSYRFVDSFRAGAYAPARKLYDIPLVSLQWINSWRWTEELSETCRVSCQNKFVKLVNLVGFIIKKTDYVLSSKCKSTSTAHWTNLVPLCNPLSSLTVHRAATRVTSCQRHLLNPPSCLWGRGYEASLRGGQRWNLPRMERLLPSWHHVCVIFT